MSHSNASHSKHASKIFASLYPNAFTVGVKFGEARYDSDKDEVHFIANKDKVYTYATDYDVKYGELGIVESPYNGFVVVQIVRVDNGLDFSQFGKFVNLKWLVDCVNVEDYVKLKHKLDKFNEMIRRAEVAEEQSKAVQVLDEFESAEAKAIVREIKKLFRS